MTQETQREKIRKAAADLGVTHQQMADASGIPRPQITAILMGREGASIARLDKLAAFCRTRMHIKVDVAQLLRERQEAYTEKQAQAEGAGA